MRNSVWVTVLILVVAACACSAAGDKQGADKAPSNPIPATAHASAEQEIRAAAAAFASAFEKGDAKALAALWTAQCEYVDEKGRVIQGRDAIEKEYAAFFAKNPGLHLDVAISSLKILGDAVAIEDGTVLVKTARKRLVSAGYYTALHVKERGKWLMASVREHPVPSHRISVDVGDLGWLIGTWTATKEDRAVEFSFRWVADKKFIELAYVVRNKDAIARSGIQIIGKDPSSGELISRSFDSEGGSGFGTWRAFPYGWIIAAHGVLPDGTRTMATDIVSKAGEDSFTWQAVNRSVAGRRFADGEAVVLKRKTP